jgi:nucleotide-binding universal stress UspA family protein
MFSKDATATADPIKSNEQVLTEQIGKMVLQELELDSFPSNITIKILEGEVVTSLHKYVQEQNVDMMILGTRDKYDLIDRWVGTVSLGLVKLLDIPVYLIPRYSKYKGFSKVMVASDFHLKESKIVEAIKEWNKRYKSYIKFIHIQQNEDDTYSEESDLIVNKLFEKSDPEFGFEISKIKSMDISTSLLASAYNYHADLLIVLPEEQDFISTLLFKSISKEMILKSDIPVLFLHPDHLL